MPRAEMVIGALMENFDPYVCDGVGVELAADEKVQPGPNRAGVVKLETGLV